MKSKAIKQMDSVSWDIKAPYISNEEKLLIYNFQGKLPTISQQMVQPGILWFFRHFSNNNVNFSWIRWLQTNVSCIQGLGYDPQKEVPVLPRQPGSTKGYQPLRRCPGNAAWRPARPESDLKYETNSSTSPLEGCHTMRVPAAAFQPSLAAAHGRNGDTPLPPWHGGGARLWGTCCVRFGVHSGAWMDSCQQHMLWLPPANQAVNDFCCAQRSKL